MSWASGKVDLRSVLLAPHLAACEETLLCCKPLCLNVWLGARWENKSGSVSSLILSTSFSFNKVIKIMDGLWNSDLKWWKRCQSPVMENIRFGIRQTSAKILALANANCVFFIYRFLTLLFCKLEIFFHKVILRIMKTRCICSPNKYLLSTTMCQKFS